MIPETGKVSGNGGKVMTFRGWVDPPELAITDAHNQIWIEAIPGVPPGAPRLDDQKLIQQELLDFRQAGGGSIVVCHPGGCGRCDYFIAELVEGVTEAAKPNAAKAGERAEKVRAGQIKIAYEAQLEDTPPALMEAVAEASRRAGATIAIHTEKGSQAERILDYFRRHRVEPRRLVLCHVNKRPDAGLHSEPIQAGAMLEYDTFFRPKYKPEMYLWPLVEQPTRDGLA